MEQKLILHIRILGDEKLDNGEVTIHMIRFDGYADGELFQGKILPGGVDTQKFQGGKGTLSARYMLEGKDSTGAECRIFVENEAAAGENVTRPVIRTDSQALKWMEKAELVGTMKFLPDDFVIEIGAKG